MHEKCAIEPFMVKTSVLAQEGWWGHLVEGHCSDLPCSEGSGNTVVTMGLSKTDQSTYQEYLGFKLEHPCVLSSAIDNGEMNGSIFQGAMT